MTVAVTHLLPLLVNAELIELGDRIRRRADFLISARAKSFARPKGPAGLPQACATASRRGRPPQVVTNPFVGYTGPATGFGRYPYFAMDIVEGIARLDWHQHNLDEVSKPLSVKRLMLIMEALEVVSTVTVSGLIGVGSRQSQRYVKAVQLALPFLMRSRPRRLIDDMSGELADTGLYEWEDTDLAPPSPDELTQLHRAMGYDAI